MLDHHLIQRHMYGLAGADFANVRRTAAVDYSVEKNYLQWAEDNVKISRRKKLDT
jgi:hypothetical protein